MLTCEQNSKTRLSIDLNTGRLGWGSCMVECARVLCKHLARTVVHSLISSRAKLIIQIRLWLLKNGNQKWANHCNHASYFCSSTGKSWVKYHRYNTSPGIQIKVIHVGLHQKSKVYILAGQCEDGAHVLVF